jgi:TrmH family RNA methyltransferase
VKRLSSQNPRVKALLRLARRRGREKEEKFFVEGPRLVAEALSAPLAVDAIYYTQKFLAGGKSKDIMATAAAKGVGAYELPPEVLNRLTAVEEPQGVLAVVRMRKSDLGDLLAAAPPLVVIIDGVQDPGNLGTMIRTAHAAGASGALLITGTVDLYNPKTIRATAGTIFHFPVVQEVPPNQALEFVKQAGLRLAVAEPRGAIPYYEYDFNGPVAVVVGAEGAGPQTKLIDASSARVFIPMRPKTESLNAAVAAALLMYEAMRQRMVGR